MHQRMGQKQDVVIVDGDDNLVGSSDTPMDVTPTQSLVDSKGRLRHSNFMGTGNDTPVTLFDTKQIFDNNPLFWDDQEVSGSGTSSTFSSDTASSVLQVSATTSGVRTRQTFMWHNYQPAKIQHIIQTGILIKSGGGTGIKVYGGQLNNDNGLAFFYDEGTIKTLVRTKTSGSVVDNTESISNWDDIMDGSGRSGIDIDWTKKQVFGISYGWLGVDAVVFWLKVNGEVYVVNIVEHSNLITVPYMSTPNLPLRWSIENDGTGQLSTTNIECSTVISEGGTENFGVLQHVSTSGTHVDCDIEDTTYAVLGIKLKAANLGASIKLQDVSLATPTASGHFDWFLVFNPIIVSSFTYSDRPNSSVQVAIGSGLGATVSFDVENAFSGGIELAGAGSAKGGGGAAGIGNARLIGSNIAGTPDEVVLCVKPIMGGSSIDIEASMGYKEIN